MTTLQDVLSLENALARIGLPLPDRLRKPIAMHRAIQHAARADFTADIRNEIETEALDESTVGKRVLEIASLLSAQKSAYDVALDCVKPLDTVARRALAAEADSIIVSMRPAFDEAVRQILGAHEVLGKQLTGAMADPHQIAQIGPSAVAAWQSADEGKRVLDNVQKATRIAFTAVDPETFLDVTAFVEDPKNAIKLKQLNETYRGGKLIAVIVAGTAMQLNAYSEARAIGASALAQIAAQQAAVLEAQKAAAAIEGHKQMRTMGFDTTNLPVRPGGKPKARR